MWYKMQAPLQIFYCYAHEDRPFRDALDKHLSGLKRQQLLITWSDREIVAGEERQRSIDTRLQSADIVLCLVSSDFLASDYCYKQEMQQALQRHKNGFARVIPILVRPTYWKNTPLSELKMLPSEELAVILWPYADAAWVDVVKGILVVIQEISASPKRTVGIIAADPLNDINTIGKNEKSTERFSEIDPHLYTSYEGKYAEMKELIASRQNVQALEQFKKINFISLPQFLRWRFFSLRGRAYFELREFVQAQRDFQAALIMLPVSTSFENKQEVVRLRLHLAQATNQLHQFELALEYYQTVLAMMDESTPPGEIVEAHWGIAIAYSNQASHLFTANKIEDQEKRQDSLQKSWQHTEYARSLYESIEDRLNADLTQCQMGLIEQEQGKTEQALERLIKIVNVWKPTIESNFQQAPTEKSHPLPQRANMVSAASCLLARIAIQERTLEEALEFINIAIYAGQMSYKIRQAEALIVKGQILEAWNKQNSISVYDPNIEEIYKQGLNVLEGTQRFRMMAQFHFQLGRYLLSTGKVMGGSQELEMAQKFIGALN